MFIRYFKIALLLMFATCFFNPSTARAQITLTKVADMNFGKVEFDATHDAWLRMGTDGNISITGSGVALAGGATSPGIVNISTVPNAVIEIRCARRNTRMGHVSTGDLLTSGNPVEMAINVGVPYGSAFRCRGLGSTRPAIVWDTTVNPNPQVLFGARYRAQNELLSGTWSTNIGSGRAFRLRVLFQ